MAFGLRWKNGQMINMGRAMVDDVKQNDRRARIEAHRRQEERLDRVKKWARVGGARQMRSAGAAEVFSVSGAERARESAAGGSTIVGQLLTPYLTFENRIDDRIKLSATQRAVGNCYGAYCEQYAAGAGSEFMRIKVDTSTTNGGGHTASRVQVLRMVDAARQALDLCPLIRYPVGKARGTGRVGNHNPIRPLLLANAVCMFGWSLTTFGLKSGWTTERRDKATGKTFPVVPDRQRKAIAEALCRALDVIDGAWQAKGYTAPYEFGGIDVD